MLSEMMRTSPLLMGNFSVQKVLNMLIARKEEKHIRELAESTAKKDGAVAPLSQSGTFCRNVICTGAQCSEIIGSSANQNGLLELLMMAFLSMPSSSACFQNR